MIVTEPIAGRIEGTGWEARLALDYRMRTGRTVLSARSHSGPLRVQRDLYPEGEHTCHTIVVHPPGGIADGDSLELSASLEPDCAALLTTPGAGKWYRAHRGRAGDAGRGARQSLCFDIGRGAVLEWLPQETILYDGAETRMTTDVHLDPDAVYIGWEILCFGRTAAGERFDSGSLRQRTAIWQDGRRLWAEQAALDGGDPLFASPIGLAGCVVSGTLLAAGRDVDAGILAQCRGVETAGAPDGRRGVTRMPRLLVARYLGDSGEEARRYFAALWAVLRPALKGREARPPRIWAT